MGIGRGRSEGAPQRERDRRRNGKTVGVRGMVERGERKRRVEKVESGLSFLSDVCL